MWQMSEHFILRSAGFPAEWMEELAFPATAAAIDAALDASDALDLLAQSLRDEMAPIWGARRDSGLRWKTLQKKLQQRQPLDATELATCSDDAKLHEQLERWNVAIAGKEAARQSAEQVFHTELSERRTAMRGLAGDSRFQEAVFLSSPHMYASGLRRYLESEPRPNRSSEDKRFERQLTMYLQRVCTKNETTSFFGPITS